MSRGRHTTNLVLVLSLSLLTLKLHYKSADFRSIIALSKQPVVSKRIEGEPLKVGET